jgi:Holliday junction resolvasome RuvABC endonuclease subunit
MAIRDPLPRSLPHHHQHPSAGFAGTCDANKSQVTHHVKALLSSALSDKAVLVVSDARSTIRSCRADQQTRDKLSFASPAVHGQAVLYGRCMAGV